MPKATSSTGKKGKEAFAAASVPKRRKPVVKDKYGLMNLGNLEFYEDDELDTSLIPEAEGKVRSL